MGERGPIAHRVVRRRNKREVTGKHVLVARPTRPAGLEGEALKEWNRVVPELEVMGLLAKVDRGTVIRYCTLWADWVDVNANLQKTGMLVAGRVGVGLVRNPLILVRKDIVEQLAELSKQLGLNPTARLRAGVEHDAPDRSAEEREQEIASIDEYRARLTSG